MPATTSYSKGELCLLVHLLAQRLLALGGHGPRTTGEIDHDIDVWLVEHGESRNRLPELLEAARVYLEEAVREG